MPDEEITHRLRATFVDELGRGVQVLSRDLITLQNAASGVVRGQLIGSLLRTMHSLKGAARSARVPSIETSCHLAEGILGHLRDRGFDPDSSPALISLLLTTVDGLASTCEILKEGDDLDRSPLESLQAELQSALLRATGETRSAAPRPPSATPAPGSALKRESVVERPDSGTGPTEPGFAEPGFAEAGFAEPRFAEAGFAGSGLAQPRITAGRAFESVCSELGRLAEELADGSGKRVDLVLEGAPWKVADSLGEQLREPLGHLVRNAVDHGIELPIERQAAGKPVRGRITIGAVARRDAVQITVRDDGDGLDLDSLAAVARGRGVDVPLDDSGRAELAFVSGLSTSPEVTSSSGRGVGLDAVRAWAEERGGEVQVRSQPGSGATFTLVLPLERPTVRARLLRCDAGTFALAEQHIIGLFTVDESALRWLLGRPAILTSGKPVPIIGLHELLGLNEESDRPRDGQELLHVQIGRHQLLLSCDRISLPQNLEMRPLGPRLRSPLVRAVAHLEAGEVAWLLHPESLAIEAIQDGPTRPAGLQGGATP